MRNLLKENWEYYNILNPLYAMYPIFHEKSLKRELRGYYNPLINCKVFSFVTFHEKSLKRELRVSLGVREGRIRLGLSFMRNLLKENWEFPSSFPPLTLWPGFHEKSLKRELRVWYWFGVSYCFYYYFHEKSLKRELRAPFLRNTSIPF